MIGLGVLGHRTLLLTEGRARRCHAILSTGTRCMVGLWLLLLGCRESYRIGDHVLVEYDGQRCPGYVIDRKSETRVRVHFDFEGYNWQDDVSVDRLLGRVEEPVQGCALPARVRATLGLLATSKSQAQTSPYRVGDRVRVRWRQSVYPATVMEVRAADTVVVHYHGHEDAWDEAINVDRIETDRR